jgi:hypothetical protein
MPYNKQYRYGKNGYKYAKYGGYGGYDNKPVTPPVNLDND